MPAHFYNPALLKRNHYVIDSNPNYPNLKIVVTFCSTNLIVITLQVKNNYGDCTDWSDECPTMSSKTGQIYSRSDIIANPFLRGLVWVMAFMAIVGNLVS